MAPNLTLTASIAVAFAMFLAIFLILRPAFVYTAADSVPSASAKLKLSKHGVLIVLSFDGFRHDYIGRVPTPNILRVASEGIRAPMANQFPTKTFPNHVSIATGLYPESHGVIDNNGVFDPELGRVIGGRDKELWTYRDDVVPIWVLNEWAGDGRASGVCMWPGDKFPYGANQTVPRYLQAFDLSMPFEKRIDLVIDWITNDTAPANLVLTYFQEPDSTAHAYGPESVQVDEQIKRMDNLTGYLVEKLETLGIYDEVNLILLSDHGFHEVRPQNVINITSMVSPQEYGYKVYGGTPVYGIKPNDAENETEIDNVYNALKEASVGKNFSVYKKSEMDKVKPNWHFQNNRRIMPIILMADPGYAFDDFQSQYIEYYEKPPWNHTFDPLTSTYGVHGYDNADPSMRPYFIAHGPLFPNNGQNASSSFSNIDLFPLFCKILGFGAPANNGTDSAIQLLLTTDHLQERTLSVIGHAMSGVSVAVFGLIIIAVLVLVLVFVVLKLKQRRRRQAEDSSRSLVAGASLPSTQYAENRL